MKKLLGVLVLTACSTTSSAELCKDFGPQTPRDLTSKTGTNPVQFGFAPAPENLNLCNIHFHKNAEHKASGFSLSGGEGDFGGWKCNETASLSKELLAKPGVNNCENVTVGDTIEVHWVHSSCDVQPGPGLGSCLSDSCANPSLRVETKVFLLVNDPKAQSFDEFAEGGKSGEYNQAKTLPNRDDALQFLGSTTGPKFTEETCSPLQVTWNVSQSCQMLDVNSLSKWCESNAFNENKAHGVRQIITSPELLSEIK